MLFVIAKNTFYSCSNLWDIYLPNSSFEFQVRGDILKKRKSTITLKLELKSTQQLGRLMA